MPSQQTAQRRRPDTSAPSDGSRTITVHDVRPRPEGDEEGASGSSGPVVGSVRLRGGRSGPRVAWEESVVDNEDKGKKKSKICCIFHKQKKFDESSDEDSDPDSDSDDLCRDHNGQLRRVINGDTQSNNASASNSRSDNVNAYERSS